MKIFRDQTSGRYFIKREVGRYICDFWCYPSVTKPACSRVVRVFTADDLGPPPSDTLRTLIECGAPWYVVLDRFVEEYPQWEEVLTWAPTANSEGE